MSFGPTGTVFWTYPKDPRFRYILVFKNQGRSAGASLEHSHSQLIALPVIPEIALEELNGSEIQGTSRCVYCDIVRQEQEAKVRIVAENQDFLVCCFLPHSPLQGSSLKATTPHTEMEEYKYASLARIFSRPKPLDKALNNRPYNFMLHTSPLKESHQDYYHWHFEIVPN